MSEFLQLLPPPAALERLLVHVQPLAQSETVATATAAGRVSAAPVTAPFDLPSFPRSTVDGYAVRAADTYGASEGLPAYLALAGEVPMGGTPDVTLAPGTCALIHTGGMLPDGADAVVMIEYTQQSLEAEIEVLRPVADGENILRVGEDVRRGSEVIAVGTRLRPAEIGGLMALGFDAVTVARQPRVAILSSGDEVVPPGQPLPPGHVYDINSYTLAALIREAGAEPINYPILADEADVFRAAAERALAENDAVVFTAGSSVSVRDLTATTIDALGQPGVLVHGVSVRPGKPTILAVCDGKPVIGLPGNPVSALVIADLFVVPVVERLLGVAGQRRRPAVAARLAINLASQSGREDWVAVRLIESAGDLSAEPVFGKSNLIFTLARADGLVRIPADDNGLPAGAPVDVVLL